MPEQTKASLGGSKRFECRVVGFPRPTVQWFKDGKDITHDDRFEFDYSIDGIITMVIHNVTFKDQGVYSCRAENSEGWAATAAILNVRAVRGYTEQETVHEMHFEIGGMKRDSSQSNEESSPLKIKSRYDDFISKIGGKVSIHDSVRSDFDLKGDSDLTDSKFDSWKIETSANVNNISDDNDAVLKGISQEGSQAKNDGDMLKPSSKRRLSDLDVHLRMMNEKVSPFYHQSLEEEQFTENTSRDKELKAIGKKYEKEKEDGNDSGIVVNTSNLENKDDSIIENLNKMGSGLSPSDQDKNNRNRASEKNSSEQVGTDVEGKMTDKLTAENNLVDKDSGLKKHIEIEQKRSLRLETIPKKQEHDGKGQKTSSEKDLHDKGENNNDEEDEDDEIADQLMEFLNVDRKRSRRSTTTDSGLGEDDYRDSSPDSDDLDGDLKDIDGKRRSSKDANRHKNKGYRPSSRQISKEDEKSSEPSAVNKTTCKDADKAKREQVNEEGGGDSIKPSLLANEENQRVIGKSDDKARQAEIHDLQNQGEKLENRKTGNTTDENDEKQQKKMAVPKIMIEEIESLDDVLMNDIQQDDVGGDSKTNEGAEEVLKRNPELVHESTVQYREYASVNANEEESFVDEYSVVMSADTNQEYILDFRPKAESQVESSEASNDPLSFNIEPDIQEPTQDEQVTLTPNIEIKTDSQYVNIEPDNTHVNHDNIASPEPSSEVQVEVVKDDEIDNNNDIHLVSANALSNAKKSTPNESDSSSMPKCNDKNEKVEQEKSSDVSRKLNTVSFDSGIDNESIMSEQSTAVSETPLSTTMENDQNLKHDAQKDNIKEPVNEEYLQNLKNEKKQQNLQKEEEGIRERDIEDRVHKENEKKQQNLQKEEEGVRERDIEDRVHKENEKNERKATLRKQHMVIESDDEEDDNRSRSLSIHDDDYFASTESLGMGMSRESLAFSQMDLFCAEAIPEKDENLSRSSSKDAEAMEEDGLVEHELKQQAILDALKLSEYSEDIESSELLSSDPEDYGLNLAKRAREISEEMSSINQAWSETTSYTEYTESSFWTTDADGVSMDGIPETEAGVANQINVTHAVRDVSVVDKKESKILEEEASATEQSSDIKSVEEKQVSPTRTTQNRANVESKQPLSKTKSMNEKDTNNAFGEILNVESLSASVEDTEECNVRANERQKSPTEVNENEDARNKDTEIIEPHSMEDGIEAKTAVVTEAEHPDIQDSSNLMQLIEPVEEAPLQITTTANVESKPKETSHDLGLDVTCDISSKDQPLSPPKILRATSDVKIDNGESIVLEWEISGNPVPDIKMYKDGKPVDFYDGENIFKEEEYVAMEILDATPEDSGCYEIHLTNSLGTDIGMINVKVKDSPKVDALEKRDTEGFPELCAYPPEFSVAPSDCVIQDGRTVIIKGCVKGNPPPRVQWFRGERQISGDGDIDIIDEGSYSCLVIPSPTAEHAGKYSCRAVNDLGVAETHFNLIYKGQDSPADDGEGKPSIISGKPKKGKLRRQECVPSAPNVQLEISESQGIMPQKFSILKDYMDADNKTEVRKGEVVEVLDKIDDDHWLVRTGEEGNQICYVAPSILEPFDENTIKRPLASFGARRKSSRVDDEIVKKIKDKQKSLVQDVVDTETDYVCDLKDLIDNYIQPIRTQDFPQTLKANENDIFANLLQIYKFHHKVLLPELTECSEEPEKVAEVFLKKHESFSSYLPYLATRRRASEVLYDKEVQDFLKSYSQSIGDASNALEELLSRPVDRVHEYIELLKNLIKYTVASGGDCTELIAAVQMLTDICRQVDQIMLLQNLQGYHGDTEELGPILRHEKVLLDKNATEDEEPALHHVFVFGENVLIAKDIGEMAETDIPRLQFDQILSLKDVDFFAGNEEDSSLELWDCRENGAKNKDLDVSPVLSLQVQNPRAKEALVREIQEAQNKLGIKRDKTKMPEHRKLSTKTQKVKTSTPKKKPDTKGPVDNESDRSSDDFNLINVDNYLTPEFEDGTTRPMFKKKLQKTIVSENSTARLQCTVVGIPHPKVLWLKNNRPLKSSDRCRVISDGDLHVLEFAEARIDDSGLYTARAMNVNGSTISKAELLVGNVQPSSLKKYQEGMDDSEYQTPAYFFQMNNCQVEEGRLARFDCRVVAYPKPDIVWMKDGKVVEPDNRYKLLNFNDEIYSLLIQDVEVTDTGRYTCWAHNKYGEAMTEAYLNVIALEEQLDDTDIAPKFLTKFYDQTVNEGVPTEFQCMIAGKPKPAVRWLLDEIELKPTENIKIMYEENLCSLKINDAKIKDSGNYTCHIKNTLGEASCTAGLTVLDDKVKGVPMLPKFLKRIGDVTAHGGDEIIYEVVVVGEPRPKVSWLYNHKPISETHRRFRMSQDGDIYRLHMAELCTTDEGKVTCKAVNSEGEVYCSSNLTVKRAPQEISDKPAFKQKDFDAKYGCPPTFMKRIDDMYSPEGKAAKFECKVMGIPEPVVTWIKDGKPLAPGSKYWINRDGGHCSLTVRDVSPSDVGIYTCSVANAAGEVSCVANLKIESARDKDISMDRDQFGRRLSRDSIRSDGSHAVPTLPYDKPSLSDIREESVRLSWLPAYTSNLPQDARNVKYMVEARELPGFEWNKVATGIHGNTHLVKGLRPQSEYAFRVRAENQHGSSDATQPCMLTREKPVEEEFMQKLSLKVPDFKQPPKLPISKPVVTDIGEETVRLAWKPAVVPPTAKKATPISYRLEAQELPSSDWLPLASRLRDTSYYLPELQKDRDYNIRVRAETKYGLSEPTESVWIPRATVFPGVPVKRPEITDIEPTMARVSWARVEVPTFSRDEEPLLYMLEMQTPPARDWQEVARDIRSTSHIVTDLKPGQDYRFRVKARTPLGVYSEPSPLTSLYRTLATTHVPIDRFELEDSEPDFEGVRLAWNRVDIPPYHLDEEPLLYMVEINEPPIDEWRPLVSGLPTPRYRVTDLTPDRDYKFRVRAVTPYGVSPPSHTLPVSYRRPSTAHIPTRAMSEIPQLLYDDADALKLTWRAPSVDTKRPIKYQVQMQTPQSMAWKPLASGIPDTSYRIRGLGPSRDYTFRVVPETSIGALEPLPPVSLTSLPAPKAMLQRRPEIHDLEPESLTLSWERPMIDLGLPVSYRVDVQEPPSLDWRPIASGIPDTKYRVTGLRPSRDYHFRVTPVTSIGDLEPLPHVTLTSLPVRPRLYPAEPKATEVGKDSIKLSWQPAEMPFFARHKLPVRYSIDMRSLPSSEWIPVTRSISDTTYVVKGLRSDQDYQFRIKAHTDSGSSEPSLPVTVYRRPVPVFPRREPVITGLGPDSIVLTWQPADVPGNQAHMPNVTYRIEVQDPPEIGQWRPLISNLSRTTYHVTGLRPDQDYLFRVRAQTDKVATEPTMPVYLSRRAGPPRMPREEPFIFEVHPESVKLQWRSVELPSRITDYSPVTYRLEMQELPRSDWTTLARGIPHTDFHVTNLHPDKEYNFRIRAENEMGIGEPTPSVTLKKRSVPPSLPQEEPLIYDVSPNGAFRLSWRPADISSGFLDGSPITYTIYVQEPPSGAWRPLVRRIPHTSYHVTSLHPDRDYSFRIQAENEFGVSRPTLPVRLIRRTEWRAPIETPEIYDIDETSRSLRLQWRPRAISPFDKTPMKYHVESWEPRARTWRPLASGIPDTSYRITSLPFDQDYLFRVRAEAASALSEPTYPVSLSRFRLPTRMPIYRPQLYDVEPDSVRLSWQPVHLPGREPIRLPSRYQLELRELHARDWRPVAHDIADTHYRVTGLRPQQDYEFRVRGVADDGPTDYTTPIQLYRRTTIPHLPLEGPRISQVDEDYVDLNWRLIDIPATSYNEQPLAFLIEAQRPPQYNWTPVARNVRGDHHRVTGLQRHQDYVFRIRAEYPSGLSEPSPVIPVYRRPIRPGIPISRPEIWEEEPYKARLRWNRVFTPPYHHIDTPIRYQIEVQEPPRRDWRSVARGITMTEHEVSDLTPRKDYLFRIRAELPNGELSDPTPPIPYYRSRLPMTREPSKAYEYKVIEEDFSLPNRTYIDHLTTYIPPRLPIEKPDLFTLSPETATLSWKPAKVPDRIRNTCNLTYSIEVRNPPGLDWRELVSGLTSTSYDLKNLHPRLDYLFRIRAHNEYGCSEPCLPVSLHRPIELSDDEFDIEDWDDPYRISLGQLDTPIDEAPPKLPMEAPRITDNGVTAHLSWLPARIPAYAKKTPITYIVEIKEPNIPGWSRVTSGITDTNYFVEDLLPNKDYQFRIKAETQFGVSDSTLPVALERSKNQKRQSVDYRKEEADFEVPTKPSFSGVPPRMPSSRPLICHRHGNSISLSWNPGRVPSYVKNSKMTYVVEIREPPSPLWRVLADNLTDNEFDITNLTPDQDYMFRVRAKNEFGQSEPTLPASIFREKDDYTPPTLSRSRSGSASPWVGGSRASSVDRQRSFSLTDDDLDIYINRDKKPCPPEFKTPVETTQYGVEGRPAKLLLPLRGYPLPRVSWFYMGERLDYGDLYQASVSQAGVATLDIQRMGQERVGDYKCCVENEHGVAVKIVRLLLADQPTVIEPMRNLSLGVRGSGKLECRVDGTPYPTVKFLKDMRSVVGSSRIKIDHTPPNLWTLSIDGAMSMDAGTYTCIAENMAGKVLSVAKVTLADEDEEDSETVTMETPIKEKLCEEDYYILEEIGRGRHGVVRRVVDKITGEEYAAKFIPVADDKQRQFFMHEMRNLRSISHKGVPRVIDLYQTERRLVIIMEIITGGNILSYVIRRKNQIEEDVAYYIEQLLIILKYLHGNKILHLDIKPSSVHFIEEGSDNICLLDFGFSRDFSKDKDVRMKFGSVDFTSPEQIANDRVSAATDLWNVGLLTHTLLGGESPFHERTEADTLRRIQECDWSINEDAFDGISTEARDFIKKLLVKEPSERMSLADCLNHPFIKGDCEDGQGQKLNTEKLRAYSKTLRERKSRHLLQTTANLVSLQMIMDNKDEVQPVLKGQKNEVGDVTYPESSAFGEFVDEESWFDWQTRAFGGDDDLGEQTDSEPMTRNPALLKEAEWRSVAEDYKQQSQKPQDFFPKEEVDADNPQFLTKLGNLLFRPGEDITLACRVANVDSLAVSWYRNDELLSESSRIKITMSDSGEASLVVCTAKPYDDGLYKCVVRSKTGKSSTWARVLVGELPSQPCRPIITQISSCDTLLLWESPTTDADFDIKHYRIDYKEKGTEEWLIGGYTVDQMALISWLKADTTYQFRVCATNNFGSGPYSVSSLPTKTLKDDAEDIELEPLETILLSKQKPQQHDTGSYDSVSKELTLKEENVDNLYYLSETFYRGQFSEFVLTKEMSTNKYFMSREKIQSDSNKDTIQRELEMLRLCQLNQRILRLLDCYLHNSKVYFIHEYFVGVNIVEHFSFKTKYSEDMVATAIKQVLDGVQFLHQNNIVHLNLQPASIVMLRRSSLDLRIIDFTLAQKIDSKDGIEVPINGNPEFLAPEVVVHERVSYPADIWTVGALTFLLLSGESPYYERNKEMTLSNIAYNRYNPLALYENITRDALRFIFKVLKRIPRNRMAVDECLEDRWLQGKDSIIKARQEATFTTVKLRSYVERTMANTDEDSLPDLKELRKVFELSDEKRHRFRVPERSFDAEELEKKETRITLKNDEQSTDQLVKTEKLKEVIVTDDEVKDSTETNDKKDEKTDDASKTSAESIEQAADDLVTMAVKEALHSGEISTKVSEEA